MITVNTHEAKSKLSKLLAEIEDNNEHVRICRHGRPIADLIPVKLPQDPLSQDPELQVEILDDPTASLDAKDWPEEWR